MGYKFGQIIHRHCSFFPSKVTTFYYYYYCCCFFKKRASSPRATELDNVVHGAWHLRLRFFYLLHSTRREICVVAASGHDVELIIHTHTHTQLWHLNVDYWLTAEFRTGLLVVSPKFLFSFISSPKTNEKIYIRWSYIKTESL